MTRSLIYFFVEFVNHKQFLHKKLRQPLHNPTKRLFSCYVLYLVYFLGLVLFNSFWKVLTSGNFSKHDFIKNFLHFFSITLSLVMLRILNNHY